MNSPATCPSCGALLAQGLPAAQCPACLLKAGMENETVPSDAAAVPDSMPPEEVGATGAATLAPRETLGTHIGRYKLLQEIGEGGFGIVYLAEQQEPVKRKVALKVLKPGMDTREVVARFEAERQALALMDHPNIAQVYDGGATESGRPYFVMELVKGLPLTKYCEDQKLTTKQRLDLFLDVIAAVQHAHQKGVIHRDLKPSNILISPHDGTPVVKVIDFGIAKALSMELTSRTLFTGLGQMIGTPQYMSPEQAETNALDVDTRSDVYSLGVVLYELLTGRTPIDAKKLRAAGYGEIQRLIREELPTKPSDILRQTGRTTKGPKGHQGQERHVARPAGPSRPSGSFPSDLDWIVMKALEKDRTRRYETANAFAADLRRHLSHEPVEAGPPSATYRLRKFVRRNRRALATAAIITAGLLSTAGVWLNSEWNRRQRTAQLSQQVLALVEEAERMMAENERLDSENDEPFRRAKQLFQQAQVLTRSGDAPHAEGDRFRTLGVALAREEADRRLVFELAEISMLRLEQTIGGVSVARVERAWSLAREAAGLDAGSGRPDEIAARYGDRREAIRLRLAASFEEVASWIANLAESERKTLRGIPSDAQLKSLSDALDPAASWRSRARTAVRASDNGQMLKLAADPDAINHPAVAAIGLARALAQSGQEPSLAAAEGLLIRIYVNDPQCDPALHFALSGASSWHQAGLPDNEDGWSFTESMHANDALVSVSRRTKFDRSIGHLQAALALRPNSAALWLNLADLARQAGRLEESRMAHRKVIAIGPDWPLAWMALGRALVEEADKAGALTAFRKAVALKPDFAAAQIELSKVALQMQKNQEALEAARRAVQLAPDSGAAQIALGHALEAGKEFDAAIKAYEKAGTMGLESARNAMLLPDRAREKKEQHAAAVERLKNVRVRLEKEPQSAAAHHELGAAQSDCGDSAAAERSFRKALELDPSFDAAAFYLGWLLQERGDMAGAKAAWQQPVELEANNPRHHYHRGVYLERAGEFDEALAAYGQAVALKPDYAMAWNNIGAVHARQGNEEKAITFYRRSLEADPNHETAKGNLERALAKRAGKASEGRPPAARAEPAREGQTIRRIEFRDQHGGLLADHGRKEPPVPGSDDEAAWAMIKVVSLKAGDRYEPNSASQLATQLTGLSWVKDADIDSAPADGGGVNVTVTLTLEPKLGKIGFIGNTLIPSPVLESAVGLKSGDRASWAALTRAELAIEDVYERVPVMILLWAGHLASHWHFLFTDPGGFARGCWRLVAASQPASRAALEIDALAPNLRTLLRETHSFEIELEKLEREGTGSCDVLFIMKEPWQPTGEMQVEIRTGNESPAGTHGPQDTFERLKDRGMLAPKLVESRTEVGSSGEIRAVVTLDPGPVHKLRKVECAATAPSVREKASQHLALPAGPDGKNSVRFATSQEIGGLFDVERFESKVIPGSKVSTEIRAVGPDEADVVFSIIVAAEGREGPEKERRFGRIKITGNEKTPDHVIRRALPTAITPGSPYKPNQVDKIVPCLQKIGFGSYSVGIVNPEDDSDLVDVNIEVRE